jgi:carboxypeptidase Taq
MDEKVNQLKTILNKYADLNYVNYVLGWDQQTYMPPGGAEGRAYQMATISSLAHETLTSDELGHILDDLQPYAQQLPPDSDDACLIRVATREYKKRTRVPIDWIAEFTRATAIGQQVWEEARAENNYTKFQPHLAHIYELRRQYADYFKPYTHIYDPLLDDFEPGLKTAEVQAIFDQIRPQQVDLIHAISQAQPINDDFLHLDYDEQKQWDFGVDVITRFGFNWQNGRQDKSAHPFTTAFGITDVRITTRMVPKLGMSALFSTMHEGGHALYEMGVDPRLERTLLASGASMALHESQSRMWENLVGRSYDFWIYFYPHLQETFPSQLGNVSLEEFYKGINKVVPSYVRVEADEATYNLHVMLRLELEIALIEGSLDVAHLPEAWNTRMKEYLGITPRNDSEGVLQDVHWSGGMIGYFPTYALGNLISVQLWDCLLKDLPDIPGQIRQGQFSDLLGWLREKLHRHGAKYEPQQLVKTITGSPIDPKPYIRYLHDKYDKIYNL